MLSILKKFLFSSKCSMCRKREIQKGVLCQECNKTLTIMSDLKHRKNLYYLYYYSDVKNMLMDLKFKNRKAVIKEFSGYTKKAIEDIIELEKIDCILSTPTSKTHILKRGFNQVDELLNEAGIKYEEIRRVKNTKYMFKIKGLEKRKKNIKNAFLLEKSYKGKRLLLVDDIVTTGATLETLKQLFLDKGEAERVIFFCLAAVKGYFRG